MECTVVIAVARNNASFGLRIFLFVIYIFTLICLYQECRIYFFLWLENRLSMWGEEGEERDLGLFIPVQTEIVSLRSMVGLEPLRQEAGAALWEEGICGGHGSWVGVSLLLVLSHCRENLTLLMTQQTSPANIQPVEP